MIGGLDSRVSSGQSAVEVHLMAGWLRKIDLSPLAIGWSGS